MATKLYVYTGTGNSLWVAHQLALELKDAAVGRQVPRPNGSGMGGGSRGDELQFIPNLSGDVKVEADRVGIVFPVHIWGLPSHVIQFINHLQVEPETYFFALAVNAGQPAATLLGSGFRDVAENRDFTSLSHEMEMPMAEITSHMGDVDQLSLR